jgi:hypothetical protein
VPVFVDRTRARRAFNATADCGAGSFAFLGDGIAYYGAAVHA